MGHDPFDCMAVTASLSSLTLRKPAMGMLTLEPLRAALEYARLRCADDDARPVGDGHAVVLFPGLGADHDFMAPLARFCERLGYTALHWGRGRNTGPTGDPLRWVRALADEVNERVGPRHREMTLIGWSLGGLYARQIAKSIAPRVRQVITLGTPFARLAGATNVEWLYELVNGRAGPIDRALERALRAPPPVPTTSIYSRSDGVVAWQACVGEPSPRAENIEVDSSHLGLVWHPDVFRIVADRLAQRPGRWRPWARKAKRRRAARA